MIAYKRKPNTFKEKEHCRQDYEPISGTRYQHVMAGRSEPPANRFPTHSESLDSAIQMPANDSTHFWESKQQGQYEPDGIRPNNYLSQPIWFEKIMHAIEKDRKREGEQSVQKQLYHF